MFSIVMPLWNKRHTVADTVASVLGQSWRDFELVVVDDGSTDGGAEIVASFADPRIRILAQANAGPGLARNAGIETARHDWIAFLDADDLWLSDHLAELDRIRNMYPQAGLIGTAFVRRGRDHPDPPADRNPPAIALIDYFEREASGGPTLCASTAAIPRATYAALGGFVDSPKGEDSRYWARIALERPVAISSRITAIYRLNTGGISDRVLDGQWNSELRELGDVAPVIALLAESYPGIDGRRRGAIDRFIDHRLRISVRLAARTGDIGALRSLPALRPGMPGRTERLIFALARLPAPLARAAYGLGFKAKALLRRLKRTLNRAPAGRFGLAARRHAD